MENENKDNMNKKVISATKWSSITQITMRLISPLTSMLLARLLVPEAFGVVATVTMVISFAEKFSGIGFQKYLIQYEFPSKKRLYLSANVAFLTNLFISVFLWIFIFIFNRQIASLLGNPDIGNVIIVSTLQLPLTSFSSVQIALLSREFDFKTLFIVRMFSVFVPFFITIPLALLGFDYWSLIIGSLSAHFINAILLTIKSDWKFKFIYKLELLKKMLSFSIWSLTEGISIWLTSWIDVFIVGSILSTYYLGLYQTSIKMVAALMTLITATVAPVLFPALSRLQDDDTKFNKVLLRAQKLVSILVLPLGAGIWLYRDLATYILLGDQWIDAANIIGVWALTSGVAIVFGKTSSEAFRAKGLPKISFLAQVLHLIFLIPVILISVRFGFWTLVYWRAGIRLQAVFVKLFLMKIFMKIPISKMFKNIFPAFFSTVCMIVINWSLRWFNGSIWWDFAGILISILVYILILSIFPDARKELKFLLNLLVKKKFF